MERYWITLYDCGNGETILESKEFDNYPQALDFYVALKSGFINKSYNELVISLMTYNEDETDTKELRRYDFKYGERF